MKALILAAAILLAACSPEPDMTLEKRQRHFPPAMPISDSPRIRVERIGVFADDLAYGSRRGVYVIRDTQTGQEFIGVSGVGIAETGHHQSGKATA